MMHQLTIDQGKCHGTANCRACEILVPGLVDYCKRHKRLMISHPSTYAHTSTISSLVATCPARAIQVKPLED